MKKIGGMGKVLGMIPGISKIKKQIDEADIDESLLGKQEAVILSMTPKERDNPKIIDGSRKKNSEWFRNRHRFSKQASKTT